MTIRAAGKLCWFLFQVGGDVADYFFTVTFAQKNAKRLKRAAWMQRASRRHLKIFGYSANVSGEIPTNGLLISNHLSYLDILAISAVTPAAFVSKADVRRWPLFGWLASLGGTIFIERERRTHVGAVNQEIKSALVDGVLVVVFPEGTSTNGDDVLPFRSSLLEPVTGGAHPISIGYIHYKLDDGDARNEVCYWGNHAFFPHLINLLGKRRVHATLRFEKFQKNMDGRKELALQLRAAVLQLKAAPPVEKPLLR
ncbi:MAG: lysophospholipid acyltransferase family protein [Limisphaerales bacterium]